MKKKIIALLLGGVMLLSYVTGCGNNEASTSVISTEEGAIQEAASETEQGKENASVAEEKADGEIVEIIWQYPSTSEFGEGFYRMEDALNEMMEKDIGVHVTFEPCDLLNSQNEATLMVSAGEQLDICLTAFTSARNLIDSGLVIPLDDLIATYGQDVQTQGPEAVESCRFDGKIYGVPPLYTVVKNYGYNMKKEYAEKYDCMPEEGKIYTLDEMEAIFEKIREGEGDDTLFFVPWSNTYEPLNYNLCEYDKIGGDMAWGTLMLNRSFEDTTIVNLFETEEYSNFCKRMYDWAQKGYISADAAVTTDAPDDICKRDNVIGTFAYGCSDPKLAETVAWANEVVVFNTVAAFIPGGNSDFMWHVTINSEHPEKAMEALNYIYKNKEAATLIQFGFEGEEYEIVKTEGDNTLARYLSDNPSDLPYYNTYGIWGNRLDWPVFEPSDIMSNQIRGDIERNLPDSRKSPAIGYSFNSEPIAAELAAVQTVIAQYAPSLNAGALDPEKALPEFISALKGAGIDEVIAENQKQFDAYLEQKDK